ncbi:MAG: carbohydrate binding family 9 domain-containing protein [Chlorobi bacterium]|nr:carbohydrate binding family 9 domain-containing protein [Chlorobiota bacterium]
MRTLIAWSIWLAGCAWMWGQEIKTAYAVRFDQPPKIDAKIDPQWEKAPPATGFYEYEPGNGTPAPPEYRTEVRIGYDDTGIYLLAVMYDPDPSTIARRFGLRDQWTMSDMFFFAVNPFKAPGNNYLFGVSASGTQIDGMQWRSDRTDFSWNAVWNSAVRITDRGWVVEMAIPYSALRFPRAEEQEWAVNFTREVVRTRKKYSWIKIDKTKKGDLLLFMGRLKGIKHIKPPVRLSLYPYFTSKFVKYQSNTEWHPAFGMDLKYGLNENFTLDMTLIPDFSDVPYDDIVLNLGPFEQFYGENRPFFTEGMQLFKHGYTFYSRRIGSRPIDYYRPYYEKLPTEIILENPAKTNLLNAVKISGRTKDGWGIGVLNAITRKAEAVLRDTVTGETRKILTAPYTNYNVAVVDYAFGKGNSAGVMNTSTWRAGDFRDADVVTGFFTLYLMNHTLQVDGKSSVSFIFDTVVTPGFFNRTALSKRWGKHELGHEFLFSDTKYDNRDLGFMRRNNYVIYDFFYSYRILQPTRRFNAFRFSVDVGLDHLYKPYGIFRKDVSAGIFATTKKYLSFGGRLSWISDTKDYYEPRVPGRFYLDPAKVRYHAFISTDYRKKAALDAGAGGHAYLHTCGKGYFFRLKPRLRPTNRLVLNYQFHFEKVFDEKGFVTVLRDGNILFGNRDKKIVSQKLEGSYYFTVKSALNLSFRHYWAPVTYDAYFLLRDDGTLRPVHPGPRSDDLNFNVWNFDFGYTWEFAPGSQLTLLYRNNLQTDRADPALSYTENLNLLFDMPQYHYFIIKAIYYLDYNTTIRKWF